MSKNPTRRALFTAIQKGERGAVLPLVDHLEELGVGDLALWIREVIPEGGRAILGQVKPVFDLCHEDRGRNLLRWEDDPHDRQTRALHWAVRRLPLKDVPVLTDAIEQADDLQRMWLAHALFRRLKLRGLRVGGSATVRHDPHAGNSSVEILLPHCGGPCVLYQDLSSKLQDKWGREGRRVLVKFGHILERAFPGLARHRQAVYSWPRFFICAWTWPRRFRIPWREWATPEEAEEDARQVRAARSARAAARAVIEAEARRRAKPRVPKPPPRRPAAP
jgi:hypothetical protein